MCSEVYDHEGNVGGLEQLLWKGLRVRIGMACGKPQYRKPLNTGTPLPRKLYTKADNMLDLAKKGPAHFTFAVL